MGLGGDVVAAYAGLTSYEFNFDYEKAPSNDKISSGLSQ